MENKTMQMIIIGLIVAILIALLASFFASSNPDGFERTIEVLWPDFNHESHETPMPDYTIPFIGETPFSSTIAGIIGIIIVFLLAYALGILLKKRKNK
jgi:cobalt/nickel transport protein